MPPPTLGNFSPAAVARCLPFVLFMAMLALRGYLPESVASSLQLDTRWLYALQALPTLALLWLWRREYGELTRQNWPDARELLLAVGVGVAVFVAWIHLDAPWMQLSTATAPFVPLDAQGRPDAALIAIRLLGAVLVVPLMEELFWRSFLMRWIEHPQFERVEPTRVGFKGLVLSTFVFMLAHTLWLAAIVAGLAYAWLYRWRGHLASAVVAHAVTNALLGLWVIQTGRWEFW
ncbi:CAAX prenyl protease-related protein [Roseateles paludis]|jgi:CAAX prenyl protease-like protein|uniref:CAAX prenyl protease-related protein n=1 Tax=Roseateles paludis TaxID=3145238 RepID=A0ABV0FVH8_9BURK